MEILWSVVIGVLITAGIYLLLERHILRVIFGLILLSNAVNLAIFTAGRLTKSAPALISQDATILAEGAANSLPQALILTAIVIGFGLLVFALVLGYRLFKESGTADMDQMLLSEQEDKP
jgi:multicomponent Na+:H+ antiporter subunit C